MVRVQKQRPPDLLAEIMTGASYPEVLPAQRSHTSAVTYHQVALDVWVHSSPFASQLRSTTGDRQSPTRSLIGEVGCDGRPD